jgi:hypothetical protein
MEYYLGDALPLHKSPQNLFCLRYDLHYRQFNRAHFAILSKCGKLVLHFLRDSAEYANHYHNVIFNHNNKISHEALYARFAWALMNIVKDLELNPNKFKFLETRGNHGEGRTPGGSGGGSGGGGPSEMRQHRHEDRDGGDGEDGNDSDDGDTSGTYQPGGSTLGRQKKLDALSLQPDSWLYDVLHKVVPGNSQTSLEAEVHEIEEDLRRAARDPPFLGACEENRYESVLMTSNLVDSTIEPTTHNYEHVLWYPGMKVVERRKQAYLDSHPQIRAYSGPLQSNCTASDSD